MIKDLMTMISQLIKCLILARTNHTFNLGLNQMEYTRFKDKIMTFQISILIKHFLFIMTKYSIFAYNN